MEPPLVVDIVPMSRLHLEEVYSIEVAVYPCPWPMATFENEIARNPHARYSVALSQGEVVGYIGLWIVLDEAHITNIAVSPECRRRKIGEQLLVHTIEDSLRRGGRSMFLEVRRYNLPAQRLYTRYGFVPTRIRERYYQDNDEDAIELRLRDMRRREFIERFKECRNALREHLLRSGG